MPASVMYVLPVTAVLSSAYVSEITGASNEKKSTPVPLSAPSITVTNALPEPDAVFPPQVTVEDDVQDVVSQ
jgi:hypothetical protein